MTGENFGKPSEIIDEAYLTHIRSLPCVVMGCPEQIKDPHHLKTQKSGRNDYTAIPACRAHHSECHTIGVAAFNRKYFVDCWRKAFELYQHWVNR